MTAHEGLGWRDRAIALASLGAASLGRTAFATADVIGEKPLRPAEMQVLVALALEDSLAAEPLQRIGIGWLSRALGLEELIVHEVVAGLERAQLIRRFPDAVAVAVTVAESQGADGDDEDPAPSELVIAVTEPGARRLRAGLTTLGATSTAGLRAGPTWTTSWSDPRPCEVVCDGVRWRRPVSPRWPRSRPTGRAEAGRWRVRISRAAGRACDARTPH